MTPANDKEREERSVATNGMIAAVDLGSNSFHMVVARARDGELQTIDHLREMVQLSTGLRRDGFLGDNAQKRAIACLARFGQRLKHMPRGSVRAVGTHTLRQAKNSRAFLVAARRALGHPIEIVAGREEARLIYLGVSHTLSGQEQRLVIDIGGGSTEIIVGRGFEALKMESVGIGCINAAKLCFADGLLNETNMKHAEIAARLELQEIEAQIRELTWDACFGSSGTINAIHQVVRANGWSSDGITLESLHALHAALLKARRIERLSLPGLKPERAPIFPSGVAVLGAVFDSLGIERLRYAEGALREGVLYDLLGRIRHEDIRDRTIGRLCMDYRIDPEHARRVEQTALGLLAQVRTVWRLEAPGADDLLRWAARLHELGLQVAHSQYHKHGGYLVANSDMPGFSRQDQELLAVLIRSHRRKIPTDLFRALGKAAAGQMLRICVLLRLAVLVCRSRTNRHRPPLLLQAGPKRIVLAFPKDWLAQHPLTQADLMQEKAYLRSTGFQLSLKEI